jgi:hypothetical protein
VVHCTIESFWGGLVHCTMARSVAGKSSCHYYSPVLARRVLFSELSEFFTLPGIAVFSQLSVFSRFFCFSSSGFFTLPEIVLF